MIPWTVACQSPLSFTISSVLHRVYSNSCPLSRWCYLIFSSTATLFSFCLQSFPASGSFPVTQFFTTGVQSIGGSASASVLPVNIQGWFPLGLTSLISLQSKRVSKVFTSMATRKHQFLGAQPSLWSNSHIHIGLLEKPKVWLYRPLSAKWCHCILICRLVLFDYIIAKQIFEGWPGKLQCFYRKMIT